MALRVLDGCESVPGSVRVEAGSLHAGPGPVRVSAGWDQIAAKVGARRPQGQCVPVPGQCIPLAGRRWFRLITRNLRRNAAKVSIFKPVPLNVGINLAKLWGMNDRDDRRYDRTTRVQTFGTENINDFASGSKAVTHFGNVDRLIEQLDAAKAGQTPNRVSKETLLDALSIDLQNIARTARYIELKDKENGFAEPFRLPNNTSEPATVTHTDAVLKRLEDQRGDPAATKTAKAALRTRFIEYELPDDFVANLRADRDAITETNQHNQAETQGGVENTGLIGKLLAEASLEVAGLDVIMKNKYTRQPEKLRAWQSASRVERAPQREKKSVVPISGTSTGPSAKAA